MPRTTALCRHDGGHRRNCLGLFHHGIPKRRREAPDREPPALVCTIGVEWPWLTPLIKLLIKAPRNRFVDGTFWMMEKLWRGYAIKNRIHPHKLSFKEFVTTVRHFMDMDA